MAKGIERLSDRIIKSKSKVGMYADGGGLYLRVAPGGSKGWVFRYMQNGTAHNMGLGPLHTVSLTEARERARHHRLTKLDGFDPIQERRATVKANATTITRMAPTFATVMEAFLADKQRAWKDAREADNWRTTLGKLTTLQPVPMDEDHLDTGEVRRALDPVFADSYKRGKLLQYRVAQVIDRARADGHFKGENPARWKGHLATIYHAPAADREAKGFDAMDYRELPEFMATLRTTDDAKARAIEFMILTASRRGEVARDEHRSGASWAEFDLATATWTIPGTRMKKGKPHTVPLSERAVAILREMAEVRTGPEVFATTQSSMSKWLRTVRPGVTLHGFRSSFATWAQDTQSFPHQDVMHCIAHVEGTASDLAYKRGDALDKRRAIMTAWGAYCEGGQRTAATSAAAA